MVTSIFFAITLVLAVEIPGATRFIYVISIVPFIAVIVSLRWYAWASSIYESVGRPTQELPPDLKEDAEPVADVAKTSTTRVREYIAAGLRHLGQDRFVEAAQTFLNSLSTDMTLLERANVLGLVGRCYQEAERFQDAEDFYNRALTMLNEAKNDERG